MRASRLPESDPVVAELSSSSTSTPSPRRSSTMASATPRSRPDGLSISQKRMNWASSRSRSSVDTAWITPRTLPLDGPALSLPAGYPAVHDVDDLPRAEALEQAGGDGRALPRGADRRDRAVGVELLRQLADVVVWDVDRARDVPRIPLGAVAHVEHLDLVRSAVEAIVQLGHGE